MGEWEGRDMLEDWHRQSNFNVNISPWIVAFEWCPYWCRVSATLFTLYTDKRRTNGRLLIISKCDLGGLFGDFYF